MPSVFIIGASGYIGGSVLAVLQKEYREFEFVALLRSPDSAKSISQTGVRTVIGTFDNHDILEQLASEADIVINTADCDDVTLTEDLLRGIKKRWQSSGKVGTLIHTSGSANFMDGSKEGKFNKDSKVWTDSEEDVKLITPALPHGQVDAPILQAGTEGFVNTYIICPSGVYGPAIGVGAERRISVCIRFYVGYIKQFKAPPIINEGSNVFGLIHINDLMAVYTNVFGLALKSLNKPSEASPYSRYFIANTYDIPAKKMLTSIAGHMKQRGEIESSEPINVKYEEAGSLAFIFAGNSRCLANRSKEMFGWLPKERRFEDGSVAADVDACLAFMA